MPSMNHLKKTIIGLILIFFGSGIIFTVWAGTSPEIPVKGMVTLVDLGANACIPCKMMAPILGKTGKSLSGQSGRRFYRCLEKSGGADRFNIRVIPTQIFFDKKGKEVYRHEGFLSERISWPN